MQKPNRKNLGIESIRAILQELHKELHKIYGNKLQKIILYGSYARAEASEDSDIDVVVLLRGEVLPGREIDRMLDVITDINLKYNTLIAVYPVSEQSLLKLKSPLLLNIRADGVSI